MTEAKQQDAGNGPPPALVCWYSGGFTRDEGVKTLETLQRVLKKAGIKDQLVLDHSNEYGFTGEGYEPWPLYVDKLVELIDKSFAGRPLIILGHSKGTCPAMSVASRLGSRVLKTYVIACSAWLPGRQTPWEKLSKGFKVKGDQGLLAWFASLNPGNLLLETVAYAPADQFDGLVESSAFLKSKLTLMKLQYRDAMYPDMSKGVIAEFPAELCAVSPSFDYGSQPFDMLGFRKFSKKFEMWKVPAGHADVLSNADFLARLSEDMLVFFGVARKARPPEAEPEPEPWLTPLPRAPPVPPAPAPPPPKPSLTPADMREIFALLNRGAGEGGAGAPPEAPALPPVLPAGAGLPEGTTYTVRVELARPGGGAAGPAKGGRKKAGAGQAERREEQVVAVDLDKGPLLQLPDGSARFLLEVPSFVRVADGGPQYGPGAPAWSGMQSTDQKVLLDIAARANRGLRERAASAAARGRAPEGALPEYLQGFEPRGKEAERSFWEHFRVGGEAAGEREAAAGEERG